MANDYEIFEGKTLSDVFKDIYDNSKTIKEYLEINVKNDEQLVKLATVVQRIMAAEGRISSDSGDEFGLTEAEKKQLMDAIESDVHELQDHQDKIISTINKE